MVKQGLSAEDQALIRACREIGFMYEVSSEKLKDDDELLDLVVAMVRDVCDWSRSRIKTRIGNLRKRGRLYTLREMRAKAVTNFLA